MKPISREQDDYEYCLRKTDALIELMTSFTGPSQYDHAMMERCLRSMSGLLEEVEVGASEWRQQHAAWRKTVDTDWFREILGRVDVWRQEEAIRIAEEEARRESERAAAA